jgi:signal peptidase I
MNKVLKFILWTGAIVGGLVLLGRLLLFETWTIPTDPPTLPASVAPTLAAGDLVIVLTRGKPAFGDLVRCPDPETPGRFVVGRIVGLPGDEVEVIGHTVRVNGRAYDSSDACTENTFKVASPDSGREVEMQCGRVEMGGGWHFRGHAKTPRKGNDHKKRVGEGYVLLLSDNRDMHDDSRDFGPLPIDGCTERIVFRLWGTGGWTDSSRRMDVIR